MFTHRDLWRAAVIVWLCAGLVLLCTGCSNSSPYHPMPACEGAAGKECA